MSVHPPELVGTHVFEVGSREGIPFVTFATGPTTRRQVRLVIETTTVVESTGRHAGPPGALSELMYLTVKTIDVRGGELGVMFDLGARLRVSADRTEWTTGAPWWLTDWYATPFW